MRCVQGSIKAGVVVIVWGLMSLNGYAALPAIEEAIMNKDYAKVRNLAINVLSNTPSTEDRILAQYYEGLAELRLGRFLEARTLFQNIMDANPSQEIYDKAALCLTEAFYLAGLYTDAHDTADALLKKSPHSAFISLIYLKIAGADLKLMRWEEAGSYLNKIITEFPQSPEAPIAKQLLEEKQYFAVQVGSFLEKSRALALIDDLKTTGQYAYVIETNGSKGEKYYRVRVGQMSSLQDAQALKKRLDKLGYPTLIYP